MEAFGRRDDAPPPPSAPAREPMVRAPWPVLALVGAILLAYALQSALLPTPVAAARFGFASDDPAQGRWSGLLTALFVHGSWAHAGFNALAALAFGAPVARMTGRGPRGVAVFAAFYLVCGALASLVYAAVAPPGFLVGASGAIAGLMGAASRLDPRDPSARLVPLTARPVLGMAAGWVVVNLLIGLAGIDLGAAGAPVAWQAHLGGYAAGLLLAPVARRLAGPVRAPRDQGFGRKG